MLGRFVVRKCSRVLCATLIGGARAFTVDVLRYVMRGSLTQLSNYVLVSLITKDHKYTFIVI